MPRDQIHDAALPKVIERHLRPDLPPSVRKQPGDGFRHVGVSLRQHAIERPTAPSGFDGKVDFEDGGNLAQLPKRHLIEMATFDLRVQRNRDAGAFANVRLTPSETMPEPSEHPPDREIVHTRIVAVAAYPRLNRRLRQLPAAPRSTKRPKPRWPAKTPSRMTGRPRMKTERTAPVSSKPS